MNEITKNIQAMQTELIARGRCQRVLMNNEGNVCLLGARAISAGFKENDINMQADGDTQNSVYTLLSEDPTVKFLASVIRPNFTNADTTVFSFNDGKMDDNEVLAFLHEAEIASKELGD